MGTGYEGGGVDEVDERSRAANADETNVATVVSAVESPERNELPEHPGLVAVKQLESQHTSMPFNIVRDICKLQPYRVATRGPDERYEPATHWIRRVHLFHLAWSKMVHTCKDMDILISMFVDALGHNDACAAGQIWDALHKLPLDAPRGQSNGSLFGDAYLYKGVLGTIVASKNANMLKCALHSEFIVWPLHELVECFRQHLMTQVWTKNGKDRHEFMNHEVGQYGHAERPRITDIDETTHQMFELIKRQDANALLKQTLPYIIESPGVGFKHLPDGLALLGMSTRFLWRLLRSCDWPQIVLIRTLNAAVVQYTAREGQWEPYKQFVADLFNYIHDRNPEDDLHKNLVKIGHSDCNRKTRLQWTHRCQQAEQIPVLLGVVLNERWMLGTPRTKSVPVFGHLAEPILTLHDWPTHSLIAFLEESLCVKAEQCIALGFKKLESSEHKLPTWWADANTESRSFPCRLVQQGYNLRRLGALPLQLPLAPHQQWDIAVLHEALAMAITVDDSQNVDDLLRVMDKPIPVETPKYLKEDFERDSGDGKGGNKKRKAPVGTGVLPGDPPPLPRELFLSFVARHQPKYLSRLFRHAPSKPVFTAQLLVDPVVALLKREVELVSEQVNTKTTPQRDAVLKDLIATNAAALEEFVLPPLVVTPDDLPPHVSELLRGRLACILNALYAPPDGTPGSVGGRGYEMTKSNFSHHAASGSAD